MEKQDQKHWQKNKNPNDCQGKSPQKQQEGLSTDQRQMMQKHQKMLQHQQQIKMNEEMQESIRQQMELQCPLVGEERQVFMMLDQFSNNEGFYIKIQNMLQKYRFYRKTRRDGACFYRAFTFCILENIFVRKDKALQEHMVKKMQGAKQMLLKANYEGMIFQDILDMFVEKLKDEKTKTIEDVISTMCDPQISNYLTLMLRFITAGELKIHEQKYQTFIDNELPIEFFCQLEVQPNDKQADQIQMMALLNYMEVAIKIVYLDSNVKSKEAYEVVLPQGSEKDKIKATMLYRPGHYDILYE